MRALMSAVQEPAISCAETVVIMSVYAKDHPEHVRQAISSILTQDYTDFDLFLCVDGPVAEAVAELLDGLDDPRVRIFRQPRNLGLAAALNRLLAEALKAPYRYVARMDADDVADRARLRKQIAFLEENAHVDVLGSHCEEIDGEGRRLGLKHLPTSDRELKARLLRLCPFVHSTVVFRRRVFDEEDVRYRTDTHLTEDLFLWADLAARRFVFANLPEPLLQFRVGPEFYRRRRGLAKATSEFRARRHVARALDVGGAQRVLVPCLVFGLRLLPPPLLRLCYRFRPTA